MSDSVVNMSCLVCLIIYKKEEVCDMVWFYGSVYVAYCFFRATSSIYVINIMRTHSFPKLPCGFAWLYEGFAVYILISTDNDEV